MAAIEIGPGSISIVSGREYLLIEGIGNDAIRVRASRRTGNFHNPLIEETQALIDTTPRGNAKRTQHGAELCNGNTTVKVTVETGSTFSNPVHLAFLDSTTGEVVLEEARAHFWYPGPRMLDDDGSGTGRVEQRFQAYDDEKLFGLGQHIHGKLDHKGLVVDLVQRNAEISVPFALSNRGYGFLWNTPAVGRAEFALNGTRWVADNSRLIDYWITAARDPKDILARYADSTGHSPRMPTWATGFWQSKLRYMSQEELLEVAREYKRRGLPISVIVVDYFAWTRLGDWKFDPNEWPDPAGAIAELKEMGIELMVSVWPSVNPSSENFDEMVDRNLLMGRSSGLPFTAMWTDKGANHAEPVAFYDPTNPEARKFIWQKVEKNYLDKGARIWWIDACEPEIRPADYGTLHFYTGPGAEVANVYPRENARAFFEGMKGAGHNEIVLLSRSAWAGSQRYGAAVWSGDIDATWESLSTQVRAGLSMAISGIPWWTTDIGGFHGGDPLDPDYQELIVRWFQYAVFLPLFRLHGFREPRLPLGATQTGGPNEVWSFGEESYKLIRQTLELREKIRPYVEDVLEETSQAGVPPLLALFVAYPEDSKTWEIDDEFLFGPDVLVAPITTPHTHSRNVYLPAGAHWIDTLNGAEFEGGQEVSAEAPPHAIPVFVRKGARKSAIVLLPQANTQVID